LLREAEGYLELAMVFADRWPLPAELRVGLANRALETLGQLDSISNCKAVVTYLRGQALRIMERHQEAIAALERSADLDPANIHVWLALGWCYKRTGRLDLAIQSLEEALSIDSDQAIIHYNLACYWSLAHNAKHALTYLTQAFQIDPSYRDMVAEEHDFDPIRDHPGFQELTSVIV
jgi:tetratricopeptide (TPR) repeat protein